MRKLVVGLGNPGSKYDGTRHNIGFEAVDRLARGGVGASFSRKFDGLLAETEIDFRRVLLLKPETFMNLSGRSVRQAIQFYKLDPATDLFVICDDLNLPVGKLRVRGNGFRRRPEGPPGHHRPPRHRPPTPGSESASASAARGRRLRLRPEPVPKPPRAPVIDDALITRDSQAVAVWTISGRSTPTMNRFNGSGGEGKKGDLNGPHDVRRTIITEPRNDTNPSRRPKRLCQSPLTKRCSFSTAPRSPSQLGRRRSSTSMTSWPSTTPKIVASRQWDERRFAYPVEGHKKGTYLLTYLQVRRGKPSKTLWPTATSARYVLRELIMKVHPKLARPDRIESGDELHPQPSTPRKVGAAKRTTTTAPAAAAGTIDASIRIAHRSSISDVEFERRRLIDACPCDRRCGRLPF